MSQGFKLKIIDGVPHKIIEKKIDQYNIKVTAVKLTEDEYDEIEATLAEAKRAQAEAVLSTRTKKVKKKNSDGTKRTQPKTLKEKVKGKLFGVGKGGASHGVDVS